MDAIARFIGVFLLSTSAFAALFFAAGPNFGASGLYGRISPAPAAAGVNADVDE